MDKFETKVGPDEGIMMIMVMIMMILVVMIMVMVIVMIRYGVRMIRMNQSCKFILAVQRNRYILFACLTLFCSFASRENISFSHCNTLIGLIFILREFFSSRSQVIFLRL